jgi:adenine-specific DNA-methyltransferase
MEHTLWLSMMYPRLELLKQFLREDGAIFIQLDDNEQAYAKIICDEIFGRNNFVTNIVWQKRTSPDNRLRLGNAQDYILVYVKNKGAEKDFKQLDVNQTGLKILKILIMILVALGHLQIVLHRQVMVQRSNFIL